MPQVIFVNRYFYPDHSATSQILADLAFYLADKGYDVHVVASRQIYDEPLAQLPRYELTRGVHIHRAPTTRLGRRRLLSRAFDYLTFYLSAGQILCSITRTGDIVVAKTDPPLLSAVAAPIVLARSARLVNWLQDLYPELGAKLGVPLLSGLLGRSIAAIRNHSLSSAAMNVTIGKSMADLLWRAGIPKSRVEIIPNWADDQVIQPLDPDQNPLRGEWGLEGKFVIGYSGNLGRAHEFNTLLGTAELLRDKSEIAFVMVGGGKQFEMLFDRVKDSGLMESFRFLPYQSRERLRFSLTLPDVHWLSMLPQLEGLIFPSKLFGIAAAGRPILAVTCQKGEIADLVRGHDCGYVLEPGDSVRLANAILQLSENPGLCRAMGQNARAMLNQHFTKAVALERWASLIERMQKAPA